MLARMPSRAIEDMTDAELGKDPYDNFGLGIVGEEEEEDYFDQHADIADEDEEFLYTLCGYTVDSIVSLWCRECTSTTLSKSSNNSSKSSAPTTCELDERIIASITDMVCQLNCEQIYVMGTFESNLITNFDVYNYHGIINKHISKGSKIFDEILEQQESLHKQLPATTQMKRFALEQALEQLVTENNRFPQVFLTSDQVSDAAEQLHELVENILVESKKSESDLDAKQKLLGEGYKWFLNSSNAVAERDDAEAADETDKNASSGTSANTGSTSNAGTGAASVGWDNKIGGSEDALGDEEEYDMDGDEFEAVTALFNRKGICNSLCKDVNYNYVDEIALQKIELNMSRREYKLARKRMQAFNKIEAAQEKFSSSKGGDDAKLAKELDELRRYEYELHSGWHGQLGTGLLQCGGYYDMENKPSICDNAEFWCFETQELFLLPRLTTPRVDCTSVFLPSLGFFVIGGQQFNDFKNYTTRALSSIDFLPLKSVFDNYANSAANGAKNAKNSSKKNGVMEGKKYGEWLSGVIPEMNEGRSSNPSVGISTKNDRTRLFVGSGFNSTPTVEWLDLNYLYGSAPGRRGSSSSGKLEKKHTDLDQNGRPQWKTLKSKMLDGHTHGSNLLIDENRDNLYIAGGIGNNNGGQSCEWVNLVKETQFFRLPNMNRSHAKRPLLMIEERVDPNLLYCIGGDITKRDDFIEFYDLRTNAKEWNLVGSLQTWSFRGPLWTRWKQVV